jgi:hypothetical protein
VTQHNKKPEQIVLGKTTVIAKPTGTQNITKDTKSSQPSKPSKNSNRINFYKGTKEDYIFLPADFRANLIKGMATILTKGELRKYFNDAEFSTMLALYHQLWEPR